jgi:putative ABC transport system ATP-binding protein
MPTHEMASPQPEPMAPVVAVRNLTRTYGEDGAPVRALGGVDLTVAPGEFVAIMGPSGCGKSTLLNLIGGLDRPTAGEIDFMGARVDRLSEAAWARMRRAQIGFVFQFFNLVGNLSAADNIELPCLINGASNQEARLRRQELMTALGIGGRAAASPAELSGGEQQRVALARALINRPALVLADEPTGNLDSSAAREVLGLLKKYNEAGQTILMVTHDQNVGHAAHRIVLMKDGAIVTDNDRRSQTS